MASNAPYDAQASTNYKEAFALFDKRGNQRVQLDSLGDLLRACGQNPTLQEIRDLEKNVGSDCRFSFLSPTNNLLSSDQEWGRMERTVLMENSRFRNLLQDPQPTGRLPRSGRARGILSWFPGFR